MPHLSSHHRSVAVFGSYVKRRVLRRLGLYLVMMLAVVWGLVVVEQARFAELAEAGGKSNVQNLSRAFSEEVKATVGLIDLSLVQLRGTWQRDPADFAQGVAEHARHLRMPIHFTVTDAGGRLLYTNDGAGPLGLALGELPEFAIHRTQAGDRLYIGRPEKHRVSGKWSIQFTRPIRDAAGA